MDKRYSITRLSCLLALGFLLNTACSSTQAQQSKTTRTHSQESRAHHTAHLNHVLSQAVAQGNTDAVRTPLAQGADPNELNPNLETPLDVAAAKGDLSVVQVLISHGAKIEMTDTEGMTPLNRAGDKGQQQIMLYLLSQGANPNTTSLYGVTPLQGAASKGLLLATQALLAHGANPLAKDKSGQTAYDMAVQASHNDIAAILAKLTPYAPLLVAVKKGDPAQVAAALATNKYVNTWDYSVSFDPKTPLLLATNEDAVLDSLISQDALTKGKSSSAKSAARAIALSGQEHRRVLRQHYEVIVQMLLAHGASVIAKDDTGTTALGNAVDFDDITDVRALLAHGADPNHKDANGRTALMDATSTTVNPIQLYQLWYGNEEPFAQENQEIVSLLLSHGTAINAQDKDGATALMMASESQDQYVAPIQWLLAAGANPLIKDHKGKTALDYAREHKDLKAIPLLKQAMQSAASKPKTATRAAGKGE